MKITKSLSIFFLSALVLSASACKKDDDEADDPQTPENEQETITTVSLTLTVGNDVLNASWSDPDGAGGNDPTVDSILLDSGVVYQLAVAFLDESGSETEDITAEVQEEADEHFVCFESSAGITVIAGDTDANLLPIGLSSSLTTSEKGGSKLTVKLKHQPDGLKDGTCDPGETDVEVEFNLLVQ